MRKMMLWSQFMKNLQRLKSKLTLREEEEFLDAMSMS